MHHFLTAQEPIYPTALTELRDGRKRTHWMWFIFPQIAGLGHSPMSQRYALDALTDAQAYRAHPVLGRRLIECTRAVLAHKAKSPHAIFGSPDDMKFHSSMTLFARAAPDEPAFREALDAFFEGTQDPETIRRL